MISNDFQNPPTMLREKKSVWIRRNHYTKITKRHHPGGNANNLSLSIDLLTLFVIFNEVLLWTIIQARKTYFSHTGQYTNAQRSQDWSLACGNLSQTNIYSVQRIFKIINYYIPVNSKLYAPWCVWFPMFVLCIYMRNFTS